MLHGQEPLYDCKEHDLATCESFQAENRISQQTSILDFNFRKIFNQKKKRERKKKRHAT